LKTDSALVAPIFNHGDGIGCFGCVSIMSPVFISEQDAMQIILKELEKEGINFDSDEKPEQKVMIGINIHEENFISDGNDSHSKYHDTTTYKELIFDRYSKKLNLAIYYVSEQNCGQYSDIISDNSYSYSSVGCTYVLKSAKKIRHEIKRNNNINAVVFYDPVTYPKGRTMSPEEHKQLAIETLTSQVRDFVKWYKSEKKRH
jgi:hypothetical protein